MTACCTNSDLTTKFVWFTLYCTNGPKPPASSYMLNAQNCPLNLQLLGLLFTLFKTYFYINHLSATIVVCCEHWIDVFSVTWLLLLYEDSVLSCEVAVTSPAAAVWGQYTELRGSAHSGWSGPVLPYAAAGAAPVAGLQQLSAAVPESSSVHI